MSQSDFEADYIQQDIAMAEEMTLCGLLNQNDVLAAVVAFRNTRPRDGQGEITFPGPVESPGQQSASTGNTGMELQDLLPMEFDELLAVDPFMSPEPLTDEEMAQGLPGYEPAQLPAWGYDGGANMPFPFFPEPAAQPGAAIDDGFMAPTGLENQQPFPPFDPAQLQAGFQLEGATVTALLWPVPAAQQPTAVNIGFELVHGQGMQVAEPDALPALRPDQFLVHDAKYQPKTVYGKQKNPASKNRVDDNQEPKVKVPPKNPKRLGMKPGYKQALQMHQDRCKIPAAGCHSECELQIKFTGDYERLRTKRNKKLTDLPPKFQVELWRHVPQ